VRTELFERMGPLDEGLLSVQEHADFFLTAQELGVTAFLEPRSVVTYVTAERLAPSDLPYFMLRWSVRWTTASMARFNAKWGFDRRGHNPIGWANHHRRTALEPFFRMKLPPVAERRFNRTLIPFSLELAGLR
jgi:hypothetical protein